MRYVNIKSEDGVSIGTMVTDAETGTPINGICSIDIQIKPSDVVRATIELACVSVETSAAARFLIHHPETGEMMEVAEITFADGSKVKL